MNKRYVLSRLSGSLCAAVVALAASGPASAQVVINSNLAVAPPRTTPGTGICMNGVHLGNSGDAYFDGKGIPEAVRLLDKTFITGVQEAPVTQSVTRRAGQINFRNRLGISQAEFFPPLAEEEYFPFGTVNSTPIGNENGYALRLRGYLNIETAGIYTYALHGDDAARLIIGGVQVLDVADDNLELQTAQVQFTGRGLYPVEILYYQNGSEAILELSRAAGRVNQEPQPPPAGPAPYQLFSRTDLYTALKGQSNCNECQLPQKACAQANYCRESLCQPCIVNEHCGPSCQPCPPKTPLCLVIDEYDPAAAQKARCVECIQDSDCTGGGLCDPSTNTCKAPPCTSDEQCKPGKCDVDMGTCRPMCINDTECYPGKCDVDMGTCKPQCTEDKECNVGEYCDLTSDLGTASGICVKCPPGQDVIPRPKGSTAPPQCIKPAYRGGWGCSATESRGAGAAAGVFGLLGLLLLLGHRRARRKAGFFLIPALLLGGAEAHAQGKALNAQTLQPAIGPGNIFVVEGSRGPGKTTFFVNGILEYALNPLRLVDANSGTVLDSTVPHMLTAHIAPGLGIGTRFSLGLDLPLVVYQGFGLRTNFIPSDPGSFGFGDLRAAAKVRILNNEYEGFGLAASLTGSFALPYGQEPNLHSAGTHGLEPRLIVDWKHRKGATIALNASFLAYLTDAEKQSAPGVLVTHQVRYGLGGFVPVSDNVGFWGELWGGISVKPEEESRRLYAPVEVLAGLRLFSKAGLLANLGLGTSFRGDVGSPQLRVVFSLGYLPTYSDPDFDKDGVRNEVDKCPRIPGPPENGGCPDKDTDGDTIIDRLDRCPNEPGPKENGGCPWGDTDKDGLTDNIDKCPTVPGPKENQGCPDKDTDGDTLVDRLDKCPLEPGPVENGGCPEPDTDKDGLIDKIDKCPLEPGPKENQGCPDKDTDEDGIVDRLDKCPTVKGPPPTGCPVPKLIVVTQEKIELKQKIFFATDKATILPASFDLLNEVVAVLKERTKMKLRIEGHTDSRGGREYNLKLSRARAESVREYLVKGGIEPERLTSEGYGFDRPIGDNKTAAGQEKTRRTEFFIVEQ